MSRLSPEPHVYHDFIISRRYMNIGAAQLEKNRDSQRSKYKATS